jgi:hypothetical protein
MLKFENAATWFQLLAEAVGGNKGSCGTPEDHPLTENQQNKV